MSASRSAAELREEWIERHKPDISHDSTQAEPFSVIVIVSKAWPNLPVTTFRGSTYREAIDRAMEKVK